MHAKHSPSLVSVVIPTYNRAEILPATLKSALSQTYSAIEIIVVDDGSTDGTAAVVEKYGECVRYLQQAHQDAKSARSRGINASTGDYLTFLDDDDLMAPTKIERQVAVLDSCQQFGIVHCGYRYIDKEGNLLGMSGRLPEGDVRGSIVRGCFPWSGGPLVRRECFEHFGKDEHFYWYSDWGMWLRIALAGYRWACVQEPLGDYRIVRGSMTDNRIPNRERLVFHLLGEAFGNWRLPQNILDEKDKIYAGWHFWFSCRYYTVGSWENAQRNLIETIQLRPELLERPEELLRLFYWDAISPRMRIHDPIEYINDLFDHLPPELSAFTRFRSSLLSQVYSGLAIRNYGSGRIEEARRQLNEAIRLNPTLLQRPTAFIKEVSAYVHSMQAISLVNYIDTVLQNLPVGAQPLLCARSHLLAEVSINCALEDYSSGHRSSVPRHVHSAVWKDPSWLKNRSVLAIFMKSLPAAGRALTRKIFRTAVI
jgi:glycosyltransferase involved in cell wall biosynthesis